MTTEIVPQIIEVIAKADGVDPSELTVPLEESIDLDALEALAHHQTGVWWLSFIIPSYIVTVTSDGTITVETISESSE